ncbi:MAG: tetratricopeptide repeat protein, partial [Candidatus Sericytochromatia bacterium]
LYPNNYIGYEKRGILYQDQNEFEISSKDHIKSIELNPKETSEYYNLSYCYKKLKKYDLAIKTMNKCIEEDSSTDNLISGYTERGRIYYLLSNYNLSFKDLSYAINLDPESPDNIDSYKLRGLINYLYYSSDLALSDYNKALDIDSQDSETLYNRAILYEQQKKYDLALEDLEWIIDGDSTQEEVFDAYKKRVEIYVSLEKYDLAIKDISDIFDLDLDNEQLVSTYLLRAELNKEQKKYDLALNDISEALKLKPSDSKLIDAYIEKASIYTEKEDYNLALKEINYIIAEKKDSPYIDLAYLERSTIYAFMGKEHEYKKDFDIYTFKSNLHTQKGILDEAKKLIKSGKREEGLKIIEDGLNNSIVINPFNNNKNYLLFAESLMYFESDPQKAINLLTRVDEEHEIFDELKYLSKSILFAKQITVKKYKESFITLKSME